MASITMTRTISESKNVTSGEGQGNCVIIWVRIIFSTWENSFYLDLMAPLVDQGGT